MRDAPGSLCGMAAIRGSVFRFQADALGPKKTATFGAGADAKAIAFFAPSVAA